MVVGCRLHLVPSSPSTGHPSDTNAIQMVSDSARCAAMSSLCVSGVNSFCTCCHSDPRGEASQRLSLWGAFVCLDFYGWTVAISLIFFHYASAKAGVESIREEEKLRLIGLSYSHTFVFNFFLFVF